MNLKKVKIYKSKKIYNINGNLSKLLSKKSLSYKNFGELYLTNIKYKSIKGWKYHKKMISNIFLISGKVKFVIVEKKNNKIIFVEHILSSENKNHIYIPNKTYFAFTGLSKTESTLINFASIVHDKKESLSFNLSEFNYKWI